MNRSALRLPWAEGLAILGIGFGAWLIHNTFQPAADTPNLALLAIGAIDILLCFGLLGYLLRGRLREGQALPRAWILGGAVLITAFLGWIAALFLDSDRILAEQHQHQQDLAQIARLEETLRHFSDVTPPAHSSADRSTWQVNHDAYVVLHGQLQTSLRARPAWDKELMRIDEQMQAMQKLYHLILSENLFEQRIKWRSDFQQARERAVHQTEILRGGILQAERELSVVYRARWHAVGAAALTGVVLLVGCLLFWLVFDRELRRSWKARARLADSEARFRTMVENYAEPIAVLDLAGNILYVNPAWRASFGYEPEDLLNGNLLELIHPQDRPQIQGALQTNDPHMAFACKLRADYGVWHDVEVQCQPQSDGETIVIRLHDVRETPEVPIPPQIDVPAESPEALKAEARIAELESECVLLREREAKAGHELRQQRWLLGSHQQANSEGVLILSAQGEALSWNPAFARMWKLSEDTIAGHTWMTVAAHMESQVASGWSDFAQAMRHDPKAADTCWEMELEAGRSLEVYAQLLRDHPTGAGAIQFHFRDVTRQKELEAQTSGHQEQVQHLQKRAVEHDEHKRSYEADLREHDKRVKQLEKQLAQRDRQREELEETLRDHQDRLHQLHGVHEASAGTLQAAKEATRRLASGVANEFNNVLSVVLGNSDVLRENLPRDHVAQNYLDDIHQAATRGAELSQRLLAFSRNHLLQMTPIEVNHYLQSLEEKIRAAVGPEVQVQWQPAACELWVKTDAHPLEQAILHVVQHARQQMTGAGTLTISAGRVELSAKELTHAGMHPGAYVKVSLRDTGAGMDEETLAHLFEPYQPIHEGHKGDLSLATAQGIVRQSGGCIDVTSEAGKGSEWTILLPETSERAHEAPLRASA